MINKIIHFIWIDFNDELNKNTVIPKKYKENIENCKRINIGFEIKIWNGFDCYNLIKKYFPKYVDMYNKLKYPVERCDIIRLMIMYVYGGVYSDVDRICIRSFDVLLKKYKKYNVILGKDNKKFTILNDFIMCSKNHPFILELIKNIKIYDIGIDYFNIYLSTGPFYISIQYYLYKNKKDIILLHDEINPCNICNCTHNIDKSITFSTFDSNWVDKYSLMVILRKIYCKKYLIIIILLLMFIFLYCKNIFYKKSC